MKTIIVQNKIPTKSQARLISHFLILITILLIAILCLNFRLIIRDAIILVPAITFILIPLAYAFILMEGTYKEGEEYVSELQITNNELALVYKKDVEISKVIRINLNNIKSFHVQLIAEQGIPKHPLYLYCSTDVIIKTKGLKPIHFTVIPTISFSRCKYSFMIRLLSIAQDLPNFTFDVEGNSEAIREDIKYFAKHGKHLHWLKFFYLKYKNISILNIISLIFLLFFSSILFLIGLLGLLSLLI